MPSPFAITAAAATVQLDASRKATTVITVSNLEARPIRGRASVVAEKPETAGWFVLEGDSERDFALNEADQYRVTITAPPTAAEGSYQFRLDVVGVENPDEMYTKGPDVAVVVPAPIEKVSRIPSWWWIPAAVAVLVVVAIVAFFALRKSPTPGKPINATVRLTNTGVIDLDSDKLPSSSSNSDDLQYIGTTSSHFLVPAFGRIVLAQTTPVTPEQCQDAAKTPAAVILVPLDGATGLRNLCVVTTDKRVSTVQVTLGSISTTAPNPVASAVVNSPVVSKNAASSVQRALIDANVRAELLTAIVRPVLTPVPTTIVANVTYTTQPR